MKSTGIVRRIDDLGRVVIPREIRRTLRIKEGDPLELFTDSNGVYFLPYQAHIKEAVRRVTQLMNTLQSRGIPLALYCDGVWQSGRKLPIDLNELNTNNFVTRGLGNTVFAIVWEADKELDWTRIDYTRLDTFCDFATAIITEEMGEE